MPVCAAEGNVFTSAILIMATFGNFAGHFASHFVEKSNMSQNSSTKCLDKVGDTRTAIMRTAVFTRVMEPTLVGGHEAHLFPWTKFMVPMQAKKRGNSP